MNDKKNKTIKIMIKTNDLSVSFSTKSLNKSFTKFKINFVDSIRLYGSDFMHFSLSKQYYSTTLTLVPISHLFNFIFTLLSNILF